MIDWKGMIEECNRRGYSFKDEKEMFTGLYKEFFNSYRKVAVYLGISEPTCYKYAEKFGAVQRQGRVYHAPIKEKILNAYYNNQKKPILQLAKDIGCNRHYFVDVLNANGITKTVRANRRKDNE